MYSIADLFDMRSVVGARLEAILTDRALTKAKFCSAAGVSRPTMDKLLSGSLTSKTNYEKHIEKVLTYLGISPDILIGGSNNQYNRVRTLINTLDVNAQHLTEFAGISPARLKEIESGADITIAEGRDIAFAFGTNTRSAMGMNYFMPQVSTPDVILNVYHEHAKDEQIFGFWGHIGVRPSSSEEYTWFPITCETHDLVFEKINSDRLIIPCMNNKLLLVNMHNIDKIVLLDDGCDQPSDCNWDYSVSSGEIPLVLYEALDDFAYYRDTEGNVPGNIISPNLCKCIEQYVESLDGDLHDVIAALNQVIVRYAGGKAETVNMNISDSDDIVSTISSLYEFGDCLSNERFLLYRGYDGEEFFLNFDVVAFIELPLLKIEDEICAAQAEIAAELE